MYVTNVVNTCMVLNKKIDTTIIQLNFANFKMIFVLPVLSLFCLE